MLTRVGLPAIAGVVIGMIFTQRPEPAVAVKTMSVTSARKQEARLPDDVAIFRVAALAGRTTEARAKLRDLMAADAKDEEIVEWLSLVLFTDPAWLDSFILTVPEDRRIALARLVIFKVGALHADAAWELMRQSPYARLAARSGVKVEDREGIEILGYCMDSPLAADTILNPEFDFSDKEITRVLRFISGEENHRRIIEEWKSGRWKGEPPAFVRGAWGYFWHKDKDASREIDQSLPAELRGYAEQFGALYDQSKSVPGAGGIPGVEELSALGVGELSEVFEMQRTSGTHIPLETFVQLPPKLREACIREYFSQSDFFHPEMARECVAQLDRFDLTVAEKQSLLEGAATMSWEELGDYETSLEWASRMPDPKGRAEFEEKFLTELAKAEPGSALEYTAKLPAGELRQKIERIATEALP